MSNKVRRKSKKLSSRLVGVTRQRLHPVYWQNISQAPRRRSKTGSRSAGNSDTILRFSHQKLLLGNMAGEAVLKNQRCSNGEGAIRARPISKKCLSQEQRWSGDTSSFSRQYQSDTELQSFRIDFSDFSDSNLPICKQRKPLTFRTTTSKRALPKFKESSAKGSKQLGKPRFKITSTTTSKRKKKFSSSDGTPSSKRSAKKAAVSTYTSKSGRAFLKHLDFRPIQLDGEKAEESDGAYMIPVPSGVNYEGWMESNVSAESSFMSTPEMDVSLVELDASESGQNPHNFPVTPTACLQSAARKPQTPDVGENCPPRLQFSAPSALRDPSRFQGRSKGETRDVTVVFHESKVYESKACQISPAILKSSKSEKKIIKAAAKTAAEGENPKKDNIPEQELFKTMGCCKDSRTSHSTSPISREGARRFKGGKGGGVMPRCATPHVSQNQKIDPVPSSECNSLRVSSSQASSASVSGTQSQALDELSRERVQEEFDLRLGKYISMLCGDNADSSAFRRLQSRVLRQRQRTSLSQVWSELASKIAQKASSSGCASRKPGVDAAPTVPCDNLAIAAVSSVGGENEQRNMSSNKKDDPSPRTVHESLPLISRRPHSADLTSPISKIPTPSLRYLFKCSLSSQPKTEGARKNSSPKLPQENICSLGTLSRPSIGDSPGVNFAGQQREKLGVCAKPPPYNDSRPKNRTAQTDSSGCLYSCGSFTSHLENGTYLTTQSPYMVKVENLAQQNKGKNKTPPTRKDKPNKHSSLTSPRWKISLRPTGRHSSLENISAVNKSPTGTETARRANSTNIGQRSPGPLTWLPPPNPQSFKGGDFIKDVSSRVEADLQKYNAVMNRCRALLEENEPNEQESSTWTHSSCCHEVPPTGGEKVEGNAQKHIVTETSPGLRHSPGAYSMENSPTYFRINLGEASIAKHPKISSVLVQNPERSISALTSQAVAHDTCPLTLKRSLSSNLDFVDFGNVEAINRLVNPDSCQGKSKVTFHIDGDRVASLKAVTNQQGYSIKPQKPIPKKKRKALLKSSGRLSRQLNLKEQAGMSGKKSPAGKACKEETKQNKKETSEACLSRLPVRMNPYYRPTLELKNKLPRQSNAQSWRTEDTDGVSNTSTPNQIVGRLVKKKKKKLRKIPEAFEDLADGTATTRKQPKPTKKTKKEKKFLKTKDASDLEVISGNSDFEPETCVRAVEILEALEAEKMKKVLEICEGQKLMHSENVSADTGATTEPDFVSKPSEIPKPAAACAESKSALVVKQTEPVEESQSGGERVIDVACKLRKPSVSFKNSPKSVPKQQRSVSHGMMKSSGLDSPRVKEHPDLRSSRKPVLSAGGKSAGKSTAMKKYGYRPAKNSISGDSETPAKKPAAEPEPSPESRNEAEAEASPCDQRLEKCRRAFLTYKDQHPELVAAMAEAVLPQSNNAAMLRKVGPLVVALFIQWLVQYNYYA